MRFPDSLNFLSFCTPYSDLLHVEGIFKWSEIPHSLCSAGDKDKNKNLLN